MTEKQEQADRAEKPRVLPRHIAVIMDGNGRWARRHGLPRYRGHIEGVDRVEEVANTANDLGVEVMTMFTFSTENWRRPAEEVSMLMKIVCKVLQERTKNLLKSNIRLGFIGQREGIPDEVLACIDTALQMTRDNTGMILNLAFNYGSRQEMCRAIQRVCQEVQEGRLNRDALTPETFSRYLYTADLPDPDLLIRTSGEQRLSNFLLWQLSYAELYFTPTLWPDFNGQEFLKALDSFKRRERRFGDVEVKKHVV